MNKVNSKGEIVVRLTRAQLCEIMHACDNQIIMHQDNKEWRDAMVCGRAKDRIRNAYWDLMKEQVKAG